MFPVIQIGPLNLQASGLILVVSLWAGLSLAEKFARRRSYPADHLNNLVFVSLAAGILGARLFFVLGNLNSFRNLTNVLSPNPGLLDPLGGMAAAVLAAVVYGQRKKLPLWDTLDALTPLFSVLMIGVGISHLSSGNAYGAETTMPWGIQLWGAKRHPSQVYEIIASSLTLALIWRDFFTNRASGLVFLKFAMLTLIYLILIDGFRGSSAALFAEIRSGQFISFVLLTIVIFFYEKQRSKVTLLDEGEIQNG
jgi:phosphatidylglycerol:prolipoprotein diacylglycerol transferase